ncbi:ABC-type dipeptide/oligopeptide/nickel transport system, permease component [Halobacteroides halobius DSM 5150]|uniref:ABC-type dipeptide/oligopeptide/nickel transport system, permease component n=1 Tax=Halobacteroides halobius (strain ATCC 35273 / DSM 5150 / MD-1) TaxID=748449 RepID=L0K8Q4_HALHC|nr:ABC transporter permease [Halobacteroides halobius]AGB41667.1 ABC-type dipeptide/oligopeptide/nickel transport system, permease component [Halobacteroides halobius DSM 5150]
MLNYIIRRCITIIPLLIAISIVSFLVIKLPPGSYLETYVAEMERVGGEVTDARISALKKRYGLGQPAYKQYFKWISGFPRGDFGMSFKQEVPVTQIIKERIGYTVLISLGTILFTWSLAIPIGIYAAVRQYSVFDYIFTFVGFIGLSIPNFLLALLLMFIGVKYFNTDLSGLFSMEYMGAPWSFGKFIDLLKHIWLPIVVVGTGGMAGLIRVMRGQMLDELRKAYVQTARAKGLSELVVIVKHVTRIAVNPIVSTIGWMLPRIISGATIAGIVLGLPTVGPKLLDALKSQDMYLAGTIIMMQSSLVVIGTLISDILLAIVDPRIRYE